MIWLFGTNTSRKVLSGWHEMLTEKYDIYINIDEI